MKKIIRIQSLLLAALLALACSGCKTTKTITSEYDYTSEVTEWAEGLTEEEKKEYKTTTSEKVNIDTQHITGDTPAQQKLQAELKDSCSGLTLSILSTWGEDGIDNQCFKQMFKNFCGGNLKIIRVADYSAMQERLASLHVSGQAPDIYQMTNQDFPSVVYRGILTRLDDKIDFGSELYNAVQKEDIERTRWNGGVYFLPSIRNTSTRGIWWNRSIFEQAGIPASEMPDSLMKANKWTPEALYDLEKRLTDKNKGIYGMGSSSGASLSYMMACAYGEDYVKLTGNTIKSNFTSPTITRAMNMFKKIHHGDLYLDSESASQIFLRGKIAMLVGSAWMQSAKAMEMKKQGLLQIVPFPKQSTQSKYCLMGDIGGYAVPTGSKEPEAAINFIKMINASNYYEKQRQGYHAKQQGWDDQTTAYVNNVKNGTYDVIPCYSLGIKEILGLTWKSTGNDYINGDKTWETVGAEYNPQIQSILDKLG